jgi:hypothetical protein
VSLSRLTTIDSLRGFLLAMMTINHLPGPHRNYTFDSLGYFTVAEGFVFISGLIAGLHGYDVLRSRGEDAMRKVFYRRARTLYFSQLILLALLFAVGHAVFALAQTSFGATHPLWPAAAWANSLHPLFIDPVLAAATALTLLYQPPLFDVLPMYCLFLFFTPFFICWVQRGRGPLLLGLSFLLWIAAQSHGMAELLSWFPTRWYIHDFVFDPLGWQILFVTGAVIGGSWIKHDCSWRPGNGLLATALVLVGVGFFVRHSPVSEGWKVFLGHVSYRGTLAPARLLSSAAILACVGFWALRFQAWFTWPPLARLGRNSLYIFLYQIALIYFVDYWCDHVLTLRFGVFLDLLLAAVSTSTLWIAAAVCDRIKAIQREARHASRLQEETALTKKAGDDTAPP